MTTDDKPQTTPPPSVDRIQPNIKPVVETAVPLIPPRVPTDTARIGDVVALVESYDGDLTTKDD